MSVNPAKETATIQPMVAIRIPISLCGIVLCAWMAGCGGDPPAPVPATTSVKVFLPQKQEQPGLHNVVQASAGVYSGSEPEGEPGFASLEKLGVRTIVSVDGARPNVELAHQHGIHYVHVPIGYDGIPPTATAAITRAARESAGLLYVHCHHGKHRGPAATAVACIARGEATKTDAVKILELAGTSRDYAGLWRDVEGYTPPDPLVAPPELVEIAAVPSFAQSMAHVDRCYDQVKALSESGWSAPGASSDQSPAHLALLLQEALTESARLLDEKTPEECRNWLNAADATAKELFEVVNAKDGTRATETFRRLERSCKQCHAKYRDNLESAVEAR
jgi:hypothetical protein